MADLSVKAENFDLVLKAEEQLLNLGIFPGGAGSTVSGATSGTFLADMPSGVIVGELVYISGVSVAGVYQVDKIDISDFSKLPAVGVVITKATSTQGSIQWLGEVQSVFTGMTPGKIQFASASGGITETPPSTAGEHIQKIGVALDAGVLLLAPNFTLIKRA